MQVESEYKVVDREKWKRATHYEHFRRVENAFYGVSYKVDLTHFFKIMQEKDLPFYYSFMHAVTICANTLDAFRYRIKNENVVLYKTVSPSFRGLEKGTDLFKVVTVDFTENLSDFIADAKSAEENQTEYFVTTGRQDIYDISCIPWISFTHVSHTVSADKDYAAPNFTWGKYYKDGEKILLPFSVQAHHSFVDGVDLGKFSKILQNYLDEFE